MKRAISVLTVIVFLIINVNLVFANNQNPISASAEIGKYTWSFADGGEASNTYDVSDEYAHLRVSLGTGDSITSDKGIIFSNPSCNEPPTSAADSGRYILIKPSYSGAVKLTIAFNGAASSAKCRIWYNDFGMIELDEADTSLLVKGYAENGNQLGSDIINNSKFNLSFEVTAGHTYSLHTYNRGSYITNLSYESADIIGKTDKPVINMPITSSDTEISGTCEEGASVLVSINDGEEREAEVIGTEWAIDNLILNTNDTISVTARKSGENKSEAAAANVLAADNIYSVSIDNTDNGTITTNVLDNCRIPKGTEVILTVTPDDGYQLSRLIVDGNIVQVTDNKYIFTIEKNVTVAAVFEEKVYYNINIPNIDHGTITISDGAENGRAMGGDNVILNVKPDNGYRIKSMTCGDINIKYTKTFVMPENEVTINAEFEELSIVSDIDTSLGKYDRYTMNVDGKPFFFNGIQIRADKVIDSWNWNDEQVKDMFKQAANDGFTVANTQIRWMDIQPDKACNASDAAYVNVQNTNTDNSTLYIQKDNSMTYLKFELPNENVNYAGAKVRLYVNEINGIGSLHLYGIDNDYWSGNNLTWETTPCISDNKINGVDLGTPPLWDSVNAAAYYDIDVTDFVNNSVDNTVSFVVCSDADVQVGINNGANTTRNTPQLVLSRDDVYDYTYLDKMIKYAEDAGIKLEILCFALDTCQQSADNRVPYYALNNYQKTLAPDKTPIRQRGVSYAFLMCKEDKALRAKEQEVVENIFNHIAEYNLQNGDKKTVVGCQLTNEPAVARMHGGDHKYNERCYCNICETKYNSFIENGKTAQDYRDDVMWNYQNSIAEAVKISDYSVWTRTNNYGGTDANLVEYNEKMRNTENGTSIDFIGYDPYTEDTSYLYNFGHGISKMTKVSVDYSQGKNLPMIMENGGGAKGSGKYQNSSALTLATLAGGSFYNVYELCGPDELGMYLEKTYPLAERGAYIDDIRKTNAMLNKIAYPLASKKADGAGGTGLVFFNALSDGTESTRKMLRAVPVIYNTENNGVGIAVEKSEKEIVLESTTASEFILEGAKNYNALSAETGYYNGTEWVRTGDKNYSENGNDIIISTSEYDCIRLVFENNIPSADHYSPDYIYNSDNNTYTYPFNQFADSRPLEKSAKISNLTIYGAKGDYINPNSSVYKTANGNETSEGGIWWNGKSLSGNRYIEYTPAKNGTLTMRLRNTYNAGNKSKSWLRYGTSGVEADYIDASVELFSQEYQTMSVMLERGNTYYFWPVGSGINISSFTFTADPIKDEDILTYNAGNNTVTSLLDGILIIAQYDGDVLAEVKSQPITAEESVKLNVSEKCKVMLWNSLSSMEPLTNSILEIDKMPDYFTTAVADSDETIIDTRSLVKNENITGYSVTTAKEGKITGNEFVSADDIITVITDVGSDIEIAPVYEYRDLGNCLDGITFDSVFPDGNYNITVTNGSTAHTDVYVNGYMIANNIDQNGDGRSVSGGSTYNASDVKVSGGKITLKTADTSDGTLSYVKIVKSPSIADRKAKIYIIGDSLVANYYGGNTDNYLGTTQTGWGQTLANYINTEKYEVVNLANSGYYASNLYTTAFPAVIHNAREGDIFIFEAGVNDYYQPNPTVGGSANRDNMKIYASRIAKEAKEAGLNTILVNPNVTASPNQFGETMLFGQIMIDTVDEQNVQSIDLTKRTYDLFMKLYNGDLTKVKQNFGVIKDNTHTSYLGAMKYASIIAGELYRLGYTDLINTEFEYSKTDKDGNSIVCKAEIE